MSGFSLGDLISGEKKGELSDLFSHKNDKADPSYDYSVIPKRKPDRQEEDDEDFDFVKKKKEKREKKKRKSLEIETANEPKKKKKGKGTHETEENAPEEEEKSVKSDKRDSKDDQETKFNPDQEKRTVFVGNLPVTIKEKELKKLFSSHGTVECIRFRSAARPDLKTSKKVAVIKHTFHEERKNINAYIRFSTEEEAEKSCSINGSQVEGHTVRVDMSLNSKRHEQNKAIFLGNLDFRTHEDDVRAAFASCGEILDVRLVRDSSTGIGKGFGYVNFASKDSVETALKLNGSEVCGRKVRVSRSLRKPKPNSNVQAPVKGGPKHKQNNFKNNKDANNVTFNQKFEDKKSKFLKKNNAKKAVNKKEEKVEAKPFQGVTTTGNKTNKKERLSKQELKKKFIAKKLMG